MLDRKAFLDVSRKLNALYILCPEKPTDVLTNFGSAATGPASLVNGAALGGNIAPGISSAVLDGSNDYIDPHYSTLTNLVSVPYISGGSIGIIGADARCTVAPNASWSVVAGESVAAKTTIVEAGTFLCRVRVGRSQKFAAPVVAGTTITGYASVNAPTARKVGLYVRWWNAEGVEVTGATQNGQETSVPANAATKVWSTWVVPAGAAFCALFVTYQGVTIGEEVLWDGFMLQTGTKVEVEARNNGEFFPTPTQFALGIAGWSEVPFESFADIGPFARGTGRTFAIALQQSELSGNRGLFGPLSGGNHSGAFITAAGSPTFRLADGTTVSDKASIETVAPAGHTYLVVFVWDGVGNTLNTYVNGAKKLTTATTAVHVDTNMPFEIGTFPGAFLKGQVLPFAIYPSALTEEQVQSLWALSVSAHSGGEHYELDPASITLRHIKRGTSSSPGAKQVLGTWFYPDPIGLNGEAGFQLGNFEPKLNEEGSFSLKFPNTAGQDGLLHRDRFQVLDENDYRPGTEFIEIWRDKELLYVGVPISYDIGFSEITINGYTPFWLLKLTRETATGYWVASPRDALENYLTVWQAMAGIDGIASGYNMTYLTANQTTPDGKFKYRRARTVPTGILMEGGFIQVQENLPYGPTSSNPHLAWRAEARIGIKELGETQVIKFGGEESVGPLMEIRWTAIRCSNANHQVEITAAAVTPGDHQCAIEYKDRWFYFYFDGKLIAYFSSVPEKANLLLEISGSTLTVLPKFVVYEMLLRRQRPFLFNPAEPGDYKLPGAPTPGGLEGLYHNDSDIWALNSPEVEPNDFPLKQGRLLHPLREIDPGSSNAGGLYQRRLDAVINFASGSGWAPPGPWQGEYFSCRWVGAIYLDLDNYDFGFRATADNGVRMWVGKTRWREHYMFSGGMDWPITVGVTTGTWAKAGSALTGAPSGATGLLAGMGAGWYPVMIEFYNQSGAGACQVEYTRSDAVGTWQALGLPAEVGEAGNFSNPPASLMKISPFGIYQGTVQWQSHYDAFQSIIETFGYQWTETPASLESGLFPGYVVPKIRTGRDTDFTLDKLEASEASVQGSADDVGDALLSEAQGLGDPAQATQLTVEVFDIPGMLEEPFVVQQQESLSEINNEALLLQRARSILALRESPWEEVGARPRGRRRLADSFPLTGALAEFKWTPGDGLRLHFPEVKVDDQSPRQIMGVNWPIVPDGLGVPTVSFRQRPRNLLLTIRDMLKDSVAAKRNYQGQLVTKTAPIGGTPGAGPTDAYSRIGLPTDTGSIVKATVRVLFKPSTEAQEIQINGAVTGMVVHGPGAFDVTPYITAPGNPYMFALLTRNTELTCIYQLELLVRV